MTTITRLRPQVAEEQAEVPSDHEICFNCQGKGYTFDRSIMCSGFGGPSNDLEPCIHCDTQGYVNTVYADIWLGRNRNES